jgi:hypothetical protein
MKKQVAMFMVVISAFLISGCWEANKEIGAGSNKDYSASFEKHQAEYTADVYGDVIHHGKLANKLTVIGFDLGPSISGVHIINRDKVDPMLITFVCDSRAGEWGVSHTLKDENGVGATDGEEISIMNYRKGVTDIREADERGVIFSTANGDGNLSKGLKAIGKLDPDSTVAFVIDKLAPDGTYVGYAWSRLINAKELATELKKVNLTNCDKATISAGDSPDIEYHSVEELRAMNIDK